MERADEDLRVHPLTAAVRQADHHPFAKARERQVQNALRSGKFNRVGQQCQQCPPHLPPVDPDKDGGLRQIGLQRPAYLTAQLACPLRQSVQKIGQIGFFQRQRQTAASIKSIVRIF